MLYLTTTRGFSSKWHAVCHCVARLSSMLSLFALSAFADTNTIEFVYREDFEIYRSQVTNECAHIIADCASIDEDLTLAMEAAGRAHDRVQSAMGVIPEDPYGDQTQYEACFGYLEDATSYIVQCEHQIYSAKEQIWQIERSARNINSFIVSFHTFNDDGGCSCPDYTVVLQNMRQTLNSISAYIQDWNDFVIAHYDFYTSISEGFLRNLTGNDPSWNTEYDLGFQVGRWFGTFASNNWDYVYYANLYPQIQNGIFNDFPVTEGPAFLREMWNYILRPIAHVWADADVTDNQMINAFRDFYFNRDVFPTNDQSSALWVQLAIDPNAAPLSVELSGIAFTNSIHVNVDNLQELADLLNVTINDYNTSTTTINESNEQQTDQIENDMDQGGDFEEEYANEGDLIGAYGAITNCIRAIQNIIPAQAPVPRFFVDYTFHFSGTIPPEGAIDIIHPIQAVPFEQTPYLQYLLQFLRAVFTVGWWILVIGLGVSVAKLLFRLTPFVFSLCLLIASGDPRPLAHAIPDLAKAFRGSAE